MKVFDCTADRPWRLPTARTYPQPTTAPIPRFSTMPARSILPCCTHASHGGGQRREVSLNLMTSFHPDSIQGQTISADRGTLPIHLIYNSHYNTLQHRQCPRHFSGRHLKTSEAGRSVHKFDPSVRKSPTQSRLPVSFSFKLQRLC